MAQVQVARIEEKELVELFMRLRKHVLGSVYCNMAGCIMLVYRCSDPRPDPFVPCAEQEPVVKLYGYADKVVQELQEVVEHLDELRTEAEKLAMLFKQGETSLDDAVKAWKRYWSYVDAYKLKMQKSELLLEQALGTPPEEPEPEGTCNG